MSVAKIALSLVSGKIIEHIFWMSVAKFRFCVILTKCPPQAFMVVTPGCRQYKHAYKHITYYEEMAVHIDLSPSCFKPVFSAYLQVTPHAPKLQEKTVSVP